MSMIPNPHHTLEAAVGAPVGPEPGEDADFDAFQAAAADPATVDHVVELINLHDGDLQAAATALAFEE